jgi:hypothetical protein
MATQVQGLFGLTPEQVQAQQDALMQERALQYSQMDPFQRANYGIFTGVNQLGSGIAKAMGYENPEVAAARERRGMLMGSDISNVESLKQAAQKAWAGGQYEVAQSLLQQAQEMEVKQATADKARAEALKAQREENPIKKLLETGKYTPKSLSAFAKSGNIEDLDMVGSDDKTQVIETATGQQLINSRTGEVIANFTGKPTKPSIAGEISAGLSPLVGALVANQAKKAGETSGADVGKQVAQIQTGYSIDSALNDALNMAEKGIYAGGYGPLQEAAAKYSKGAVGDKKRLVNTQEFRAYIGNVIIPMMSKLGGSDSNEELKYMQSIAGGQTELEPEAIKAILKRAQKAVRNDVARIQQQYNAIQEGKPLPTGPVKTPGNQPRTATTKSGTKYTIED